MIPVSPALIKLGLFAALIASAYVKGCSDEKERFDNFKDALEVAGQEQAKATAARIQRDKDNKKRTDDEYKAQMDRLVRDRNRLQQLARSGLLPAPGGGAGSPDRITFDRAELERALGEFATETEAIAGEGDAAVIGLDAARRWVKER